MTQEQRFKKLHKRDPEFLAELHRHGITTIGQQSDMIEAQKRRGFPITVIKYDPHEHRFYFSLGMHRRVGVYSEISFVVRLWDIRVDNVADYIDPEKLTAIINESEARMGQPLSTWDGVKFQETPSQWDLMDRE
jgi:hypothetical protein